MEFELVAGRSRFTEYLVRSNGLSELGFEEWLFCPGMLFGAAGIWWDDGRRRGRPHEGLDLCLYRCGDRRIGMLDGKIEVPVIWRGEVLKVADDYLGKSVFVSHGIPDVEGKRLVTIYGHVAPRSSVRRGATIAEGNVVGAIAAPVNTGAKCPPHLHLTVAWVPGSVAPGSLDWASIGHDSDVVLVDPLKAIDGRWSVLGAATIDAVNVISS